MPKKVQLDYTGTFQRGNIWWFHVPENGRSKYYSSHSASRDECLRQRKEKLGNIRSGSNDPAIIQRVTVADLLDDYLGYLERESKASFQTKLYHAKHLKTFMGGLRAYQLGTDRSEEYRAWRKRSVSHMTGQPIADTTVNRELETLIAAYYYGRDERTPRTVKEVPKITLIEFAELEAEREGTLSPEMYPAVRDAITDEGIRAMFIVSYEVGLRAGELKKMKWPMVDLAGGYLFLPWRITKNNRSGALPIWDDGDMRPALNYMLEARDNWNTSCPYVFRWCRGKTKGQRIKSYRDAWDRATVKAGLPELLFHDLRRSTVTNMAIEGFVKEHRQLISRHADERSEARYNRSYLETLELMKKKRAETRSEMQALAAPALDSPVNLRPIEQKYESLTPAQRSIIDGLFNQFQSAS